MFLLQGLQLVKRAEQVLNSKDAFGGTIIVGTNLLPHGPFAVDNAIHA